MSFMDNEKLFDLMTQMYTEMKDGFKKVDARFEVLDERVSNLEKESKKMHIILENDIKPDIKALFDGYKHNTEQLTRIQNEVKQHDEVILRRIK